MRPRDLEPITNDLSGIMAYLMRLDAKLELVTKLLQEEDEDGGDKGPDA